MVPGLDSKVMEMNSKTLGSVPGALEPRPMSPGRSAMALEFRPGTLGKSSKPMEIFSKVMGTSPGTVGTKAGRAFSPEATGKSRASVAWWRTKGMRSQAKAVEFFSLRLGASVAFHPCFIRVHPWLQSSCLRGSIPPPRPQT